MLARGRTLNEARIQRVAATVMLHSGQWSAEQVRQALIDAFEALAERPADLPTHARETVEGAATDLERVAAAAEAEAAAPDDAPHESAASSRDHYPKPKGG
jgi:hypothetical protein